MENMMNLKMNKTILKSKSDLLSVFISNKIDSINSNIASGSIAIFILQNLIFLNILLFLLKTLS